MPEANCTTTWKEIDGFPGYMVGDNGEVWTCRAFGPGGRYTKNWRKLKSRANKDGHHQVVLTPGRCMRYVHHLVLEAFVGPRPEGKVCRHFPDRDPNNNRLSNLQWGTVQQNQDDRDAHGTTSRGEASGMAKATDEIVQQIRAEYATGLTTHERLSAKFHLAETTIGSIINRQTWRHVP